MGIPKFCKCGHSKDSHKKNPKSKFSFASFCRDCPCNEYVNRNKPFKSDIALTVICVITFVIISVVFAFFMIEMGSIVEPIKDKPTSLTNGELFEIVSMFLFAGLVLGFVWFVVNPILVDYSNKKRRKFPIRDDTAEQ